MSNTDKPPVTVTNLMTMGFTDILQSLSLYYTAEIEPSAARLEDALNMLDDRLRRLTNYHSYLTELYAYAVHYTRSAPKETKSEMMDKRDALEKILKTVELKIKTVSRAITVKELKIKESYGQGVGQARNASSAFNQPISNTINQKRGSWD